jgi:hypothetical protein
VAVHPPRGPQEPSRRSVRGPRRAGRRGETARRPNADAEGPRAGPCCRVARAGGSEGWARRPARATAPRPRGKKEKSPHAVRKEERFRVPEGHKKRRHAVNEREQVRRARTENPPRSGQERKGLTHWRKAGSWAGPAAKAPKGGAHVLVTGTGRDLDNQRRRSATLIRQHPAEERRPQPSLPRRRVTVTV